MKNLVDFLKVKRYPGRFIVIGKDGDSVVVIYGATGRSPSSLARQFIQKENEIFMVASDATVSKEGNSELLEYPAVRFFSNGIAVANGRQINTLKTLSEDSPVEQLAGALSAETYEPDEYHTPRITGCVVEKSGENGAALHIVRSVSFEAERTGWPTILRDGGGAYIATYGGEDVKPTPSFSGGPVPVSFNFGSADKAAFSVYAALTPPSGEVDYRVGVVAVYKRLGVSPVLAIVNRIPA